MNMLDAYILENIPPVLRTGVGALIAIFIVIFFIRKIVGMVVIATLIIAGWILWSDPALLKSGQETVFRYLDEWQHGSPDEDRPRW
ncbi:hypothetical protein [Agrobacterium burrii]|uniref:Uncharacterized protein n=1 Tax=Agrobacterium burrii TaxID=2815339 RepID=A0ABS3EQA1_9HYPH|nr:hypothetical protein [Agrobacterium burrii]MBO0134140.1 hypothetical protein [Agrobacterium burrii]